MKKLLIILGIILMASAPGLPVFAMGHGMGGGGMGGGMGGGGMTGGWGSGLLDWFQRGRQGSVNNAPYGRQDQQTGRLEQQHEEDSAYLNYQIQMKEKEMDALLNSSNPDLEKVRTLRRGIRELRAEAEKEQRNYEARTGKRNPQGNRTGGRDGWSSYDSAGRRGSGGMGYGGPMGGN